MIPEEREALVNLTRTLHDMIRVLMKKQKEAEENIAQINDALTAMRVITDCYVLFITNYRAEGDEENDHGHDNQ